MDKTISPSLICMDMCNLVTSVKELERIGCEMLHVDLLDGYFSPSMPIGLDTIRALRKKTNLYFDAHVMAMDNTFFMEQLVDIGVGRMCFQIETERHISRKLSWLKSCGVEQCDFVLLMMINPGYASDKSEKMLESLKDKISDLKAMIDRKGLHTTITIDGRTYLSVIPDYIHRGATTFVAGTSGLFLQNGRTLEDNYGALKKVIQQEMK